MIDKNTVEVFKVTKLFMQGISLSLNNKYVIVHKHTLSDILVK